MPGIEEELFVEDVPLRLYCSICLDVAESAMITVCGICLFCSVKSNQLRAFCAEQPCEHLFCSECITQLQQANGENCECPNCRKPILPLTPATKARHFLSKQTVYCSPIESLRCGWTGKYAMWHTHRAKYCERASKSDKKQARNAKVAEIGALSKEELQSIGVSRLKKLLQEYLHRHSDKLSTEQISEHYAFKSFLEKGEFIAAILRLEANHGVSSTFSPSKNEDVSFPDTFEGLKALKIRELSSFLRSNHIDSSKCIEKSDLIRLVLDTQRYHREIVDGQQYDPKMENEEFGPSPVQLQHPEPEAEEEEKKMDEDAPAASSSAYQYTAAHLRQSSINRTDLNRDSLNAAAQPSQPSHSAYSHVFNEHEHATNVNRGNLEDVDEALFAEHREQERDGMHRQRHRQRHRHGNPEHTSSAHSHPHSHPHQQRQRPLWSPPQMPHIPHMPRMPPMPRMPAMPRMPHIPRMNRWPFNNNNE